MAEIAIEIPIEAPTESITTTSNSNEKLLNGNKKNPSQVAKENKTAPNSNSQIRTLPSPLSLDDFEIGVTLGTGSFGRVRFVTHKSTKSVWAIKMLKKADVVQMQQVEHMMSERSILLALDHPFIVRLSGTFQDLKYLYMCLEYVVGGEFFTHLRRAKRFDTPTSKFYAAQVVLIFEYMHRLDFIYRDLKPENILLDRTGYLKLTDYGFAKRVVFKTYTLCGTPEYIAPEVLLNKGHGKGVDWWTLGILMYEMISGQPPFVDDDPMGIYQQILAGKVNYSSRYFDKYSKKIISNLLVGDLTKRIGCMKDGVADIKTHKFFKGFNFVDLFNRVLPAPISISIANEADTSNFDPYPEPTGEVPIPVYPGGKDPFLDF